MDADMQMAKTDRPGWTNLAIGEPGALQWHLREWHKAAEELSLGMPDQAYPNVGGDQGLIDLIRTQIGRIMHEKPMYVVVTHGAKQAMAAAYAGYKVRNESARKTLGDFHWKPLKAVQHRTPYWPSHKTLAEAAGFEFIPEVTRNGEWDLVVNTTPNNPDGSVVSESSLLDAAMGDSLCHIWDAAYAHPVYGFKRDDIPLHRTSVWSAAKLYGMSGDRIGWLVTNDELVAQGAAAHVEATTSGVSIYSQKRLADFMSYAMGPGRHDVDMAYARVREEILENALKAIEIIGPHCQIPPTFERGMFLWFKPQPFLVNALNDAKIQVLDGAGCGMPSWVRMNIGARRHTLARVLQDLKEKLA